MTLNVRQADRVKSKSQMVGQLPMVLPHSKACKRGCKESEKRRTVSCSLSSCAVAFKSPLLDGVGWSPACPGTLTRLSHQPLPWRTSCGNPETGQKPRPGRGRAVCRPEWTVFPLKSRNTPSKKLHRINRFFWPQGPWHVAF